MSPGSYCRFSFEGHLEVDLLAVTLDRERHGVADGPGPDRDDGLVGGEDPLALEGGDDVAGPHAGLGGGPAGGDRVGALEDLGAVAAKVRLRLTPMTGWVALPSR